jgi:hypothetical protein
MDKEESYLSNAQAYADGVRTLFAPAGPPTKERGGVQGLTSYEDLSKKAENLSGVSDDLGKVIAGQLSAPDTFRGAIGNAGNRRRTSQAG